MKITATFLLLLGSIGVALAQDTPTQATTNAQTEPPPATSDAPVTGNAVTRDAAGHPVFVTSQQPTPPPHDYRAEFHALDSDGDGSLTRSEASADKYLVRTFATYDSDRDDRLSFEEARRWLED